MRNDKFTPEEIKQFKVSGDYIDSKNYSQTADGFFKIGNKGAYPYTSRPYFFSGTSDIHYARAAFSSKELLFTTMVHETGHAYIMNAGNVFIKNLNEIKLFNSGYDTPIDNLGHAAIWDLENHLKSINNLIL